MLYLQQFQEDWGHYSLASQVIAGTEGGRSVKLQAEKCLCLCPSSFRNPLHHPVSQWILFGRLILVLFSSWQLCKPAPLTFLNDTSTLPALLYVAFRQFSELFVQTICFGVFFFPNRDILTFYYSGRWKKRWLWKKVSFTSLFDKVRLKGISYKVSIFFNLCDVGVETTIIFLSYVIYVWVISSEFLKSQSGTDL